MSYSQSTNVIIPANTGNYTAKRNNTIKRITPHHMAGNLSVETCGRIFQQAGKEASSNYGIGTDGRVAGYVPEESRAWTSSSAANDNQAITIEVANDDGPNWSVSDAALNKLVDLMVDICKRHGIARLVKGDNLTWHSMFKATTCPGPYLLGKMDWIAETVNARLGQPTSPSGDTYTVVKGDTLSGIALKYGMNLTALLALNPKIIDPNRIYPGDVINVKGTAPSTQYLSNASYKGSSITDALKQIGVDNSYAYRARLAAANGIVKYTGTAQQNTQLLNLLKNGKLKKA